MTVPLSLHDEGLLRRAAQLRASGHSWNQTGHLLNTDPLELEQLAFDHDRAFEKVYREEDRRSVRESRQEGMRCLRVQLRDSDTAVSQRAADIIGRIESVHARIEPQFQKNKIALKLAKSKIASVQAKI